MNGLMRWGVTLVALFAGSSVAHAQPLELTATGDDGDASLTLTMLDTLITSDPLVWCRVEVAVTDDAVDLNAGDEITVSLIEDDAILNDTVWTTDLVVGADDAEAGLFEATLDCSAAGKRDGIGQLEFFAEVDVDKSACTLGCFNDTASTDNLDIDGVDDDDFEDDDDIQSATPAVFDKASERVATDADLVEVTLPGPGSIEATAEFMAECGALVIEIVDDAGDSVSNSESTRTGEVALAEDLVPGAYYVSVQPADVGDLNFYDLTVVRTIDEDPGDDTGDSGGADGTGDDDGTPDDGVDDDAGPGDDDSDDGPGPDDGGQTPADDDDGGDGTGSSGGDGGAQSGDDGGCGCTTGEHEHPWGWLVLGVGALLRMRRRRTA